MGKLETTPGLRGLPSAASSRNITNHFQQSLSQILITSQLKARSGHAGQLGSTSAVKFGDCSVASWDIWSCRQQLLSCTEKEVFFFYLTSVCSLSHLADLIIILTGSLLPGQRPWITMKALTAELGFRTNKNGTAPSQKLQLVNHCAADRRVQSFPLISWVRHTVISSPEPQIDGSSYCK